MDLVAQVAGFGTGFVAVDDFAMSNCGCLGEFVGQLQVHLHAYVFFRCVEHRILCVCKNHIVC